MTEKEYRALLTAREREIIRGEAEVSDSYRYRVVSRVRSKLDELSEDTEVLREHHPDLYEELREVVCDQE